MRFLLDTCVLSEMTAARPNEDVLAWMASRREEDLAISVVTLGELQLGISRLPPGRRRNWLDVWLDRLVGETFADAILSVGPSTALIWGELRARLMALGRPRPTLDALIAATATEHRLTLVTRNVKDFADCNVRLLNPWSSSA